MTEKRFRYVDATDGVDEHIIDYSIEPHFEYYTLKGATDKLNELAEENQRLQKENKILYDENIQLRNKLLHFVQLKEDVKYLEEKGVF